jgi:putative ABC transport system substrate-binding protein
MKIPRRDFIALVGGSAATWPLAARAQQPALPVIGFLHSGSPEPIASRVAGFRKGLGEGGYIEGQTVAIEYRWAQDQYDRLPDLAADLVRRQVAVIATPGSVPAALAAKAATSTIPIVFEVGGDPVQLGLVASLSRPVGNVTGVTSMNVELGAKRLGLLHELLPGAARFAVLVNPNSPDVTELTIKDAQAAAAAIGREIEVLNAATNREIDAAFASLVAKRVDALLVGTEPLFNNRRVQLVTLATLHRVLAIYYAREYAEIGGLMSYGTNLADAYRQAGTYVGRILKGEKPAELPVARVVKFEFVINLQTARTLGIDIPPTLLARADEVIE